MEKKFTNSGPLSQSTCKHSIYTSLKVHGDVVDTVTLRPQSTNHTVESTQKPGTISGRNEDMRTHHGEPTDQLRNVPPSLARPGRETDRLTFLRVLVRSMIVLVAFGLVAAVVVPNFTGYRTTCGSPHPVSPPERLRAAIAAYAADAPGNTFPGSIANWNELRRLVNAHGAELKATEAEQGFALRNYSPIDADADGIIENYTMSFTVLDIPAGQNGSIITVDASGIEKMIIPNMQPTPRRRWFHYLWPFD
jgi:hypothetical protein